MQYVQGINSNQMKITAIISHSAAICHSVAISHYKTVRPGTCV